jgi:hypothetical protein
MQRSLTLITEEKLMGSPVQAMCSGRSLGQKITQKFQRSNINIRASGLRRNMVLDSFCQKSGTCGSMRS